MKYLLSLIIAFTTISATPALMVAADSPKQSSEQVVSGEASDTTHSDDSHGSEPGGEATAKDQDILGRFGIKWNLFIAQLINFSIILFVLWKWVFGPVTKGLTERTQKIEQSLADATKIAEERETFDSWKTGEMSSVKKEASEILIQAKKDALSLKEQMLGETKQEQDKLLAQARQQINNEKSQALQEIKAEAAQLIVAATETVLRTKLDSKKDAELIDSALKNQGGKA